MRYHADKSGKFRIYLKLIKRHTIISNIDH